MLKRRLFSRIALAVALLLLVVSLAGGLLSAETRGQEVTGKSGMVAAAHPLAAQAGAEILQQGGNAVDAAVATAFAISVVEPQASGLGGEGMAVIYLAKENKAVAIDYRSASPKAAVEALKGKKSPGSGYQSAAIPGYVAGLATALEKYGTMKLSQVMAPAIRLAEEGFPVGPTLNALISDSYETLSKDPELAKVFLPDGFPPEVGSIIKNADLAKSLRMIAEGGPDVFYKGALADIIDTEMKANGGFITKEDLAQYKAVVRWPVRSTYRGYDIISAPPPVAGTFLIEGLNILENFDIASYPYLSAKSVHILSEAMKRAYADMSRYLGDPDFVDVPVDVLISKEYARERAKEISLDAITPKDKLKPGEISPKKAASVPAYVRLAAAGGGGVVEIPLYDETEPPSTTHISVVDAEHNMVALTQTISSFFGAGVAIKGTGIILNNEMQNFGFPPNDIAPYKRMRTTIAPTIVLREGKPFLTLGTPGAGRILSTMMEVLSNIIDRKMGLQEAIEAPRFYSRDTAIKTEVESRIPAEVQNELKAMGYEIAVKGDYDLYFGGVQGAMIDPETGILRGAADPRRDGAAVGY